MLKGRIIITVYDRINIIIFVLLGRQALATLHYENENNTMIK